MPETDPADAFAAELTDDQKARAWLDAERANLAAAAAYAASHDGSRHAIGLSAGLSRYLSVSGLMAEALVIHNAAVRAGVAAGDRLGQARALISLGTVYLQLCRYPQAVQHCLRALALSRGLANLRQGRLAEAASQLGSALEVTRKAAASTAEASALCSLGEIDLRQGDITGAVGRFEQALALFIQAGERSGEAEARNCLGEAALAEGALGPARAHHRAALDMAGQLSNLEQQARAHDGLGNASAAAGDSVEARPHWRAALDAYTRLDMPDVDRIRAKLAAAQEQQAPASTQP